MTPKVAHGQAIFEWKCMFFQHLSPIKVKLVDKMMQSTYLCVILHVKLKKLLILTVLTWSLILDKIQDRGGDGDHVWWRHRSPAAPPPIKYTRFCGENQRISTEGKSFRNTATDQKPCGGRGAISLHPPLVPWLGYDFACMFEGPVRLPTIVKHDLGIFLNNRFSPFSFSPLW